MTYGILRDLFDRLHVVYCLAFAIILIFAVKCFYLSGLIDIGVLPDEIAHIKLISAFFDQKSIFLDPGVMPIDPAAVISQDRFLYHFISSLILGITGESVQNTLLLRSISIFYSLIAAFLLFKSTFVFGKDSLWRVVPLLLYTNILMNTIVSITIGYDALVSLLAVYQFYKILLWEKSSNGRDVIDFLIVSILGTIVKPSLYPLTAILFLYLFCKPRKLKDAFDISLLKERLRLTILVTISFCVIIVHVKNISSYGKFVSLKCADIYSTQLCYDNIANKRAYEGLKKVNKNKPRLDIVAYYDQWVDIVIKRSFGIFSHKSMHLSSWEFAALKILLIIGSLMGCIACHNKIELPTVACGSVYVMFVLLYVNYSSYWTYGDVKAGVHGRYLFPVLMPFLFLITRGFEYLINWIPKIVRALCIIIILLFFVFLDFSSFLRDENYSDFVAPKEMESGSKGLMKNGLFHIDKINGNLVKSQNKYYHKGELKDFEITGWAFNKKSWIPLDSIGVSYGASDYGKSNYGREREDVARAFKKSALINVGYGISVDIIELDSFRVHFHLYSEKNILNREYLDIVRLPPK